MKNSFLTLSLLAVISIVAVSVSFAQKKITVHGNIVEVTTFVKEGLQPSSPSKKEVIMESLKKGGMLGIVDKAKKLYLLVPGPSDTTFMQTVSPYLGVKSFVKGQVYTRAGIRVIVLEDIGKSLK